MFHETFPEIIAIYQIFNYLLYFETKIYLVCLIKLKPKF